MFISSSANFVEMSSIINHTIYSRVENGTVKLKEEEQFVIKLYHPFIINWCRTQFTSIIKSNKERLAQNSLLGSVLCPYCSHGISSPEEYDYQPNRIMRPPFSIPKTTKNTNLGFYKLQKAQFQALDFDIFLGEHSPGTL